MFGVLPAGFLGVGSFFLEVGSFLGVDSFFFGVVVAELFLGEATAAVVFFGEAPPFLGVVEAAVFEFAVFAAGDFVSFPVDELVFFGVVADGFLEGVFFEADEGGLVEVDVLLLGFAFEGVFLAAEAGLLEEESASVVDLELPFRARMAS